MNIIVVIVIRVSNIKRFMRIIFVKYYFRVCLKGKIICTDHNNA